MAQTPGSSGNWFIGTVVLPGTQDKKWGGYAEVQARTNGLFREYFYHELKGGLSYALDPRLTVMLAGGRYGTNNARIDNGLNSVEKRLWLQLSTTNTYLRRLQLEHRFRAEQRWFNYSGDSTSTSNRLRYRLSATVPLNRRKIDPQTVFLSFYDELFLNPKGPVLERNRVYAGAGYQFTRQLNVQAGWLRQANYNQPTLAQGQFLPLRATPKNNLVLMVVYKLAHRSSTPDSETIPTSPD